MHHTGCTGKEPFLEESVHEPHGLPLLHWSPHKGTYGAPVHFATIDMKMYQMNYQRLWGVRVIPGFLSHLLRLVMLGRGLAQPIGFHFHYLLLGSSLLSSHSTLCTVGPLLLLHS